MYVAIVFEAFDRAATGRDPDEVEQLEGADDRQEDGHAQGRPEQGQGHVADRLAPGGAIDRRRFLELVRDALQTGQQQDHVEAEVLPRDDEEHRQHDRVRVREPRLVERAQADRVEQAVGQSTWLEEQAPHDTGDDLRDDIRGEEDEPEDGAAPEPAAEDERQPEREWDLDDERQDDDEDVVLDGPLEDGLRQRALVVGKADEVGQRCQAVPLEEAVVDRLDDREEHEDRVQGQGGQQEQGDRRALARATPGALGGVGADHRRHVSTDDTERAGPEAGPFDIRWFVATTGSWRPSRSPTRPTRGCPSRRTAWRPHR